MKKRKKKKISLKKYYFNHKEKKKIEFDLNWGLRGLKTSLVILIFTFIIEFFYIVFKRSFKEAIIIIFSIPKNSVDFLAILAGVLLFIAIPFLSSIKIGLYLKKK